MTGHPETETRRGVVIACRHLSVPTVALALVLLGCPGAGAGPPTDAVRGVFAEANRVLIDPVMEHQPAKRLIAVRQLLDAAFEFRDAAELALGPAWRARTATEQDEFVRLFADLLQLSFLYRMASATQTNIGVIIRYRGEEMIDGDVATVRTAIASKDGRETLLDYVMVRRGEQWMVRDVLIEGIGLVGNYRTQFDRVIRQSSYPELVARMKAKTADWSRMATASTDTAGDGIDATPSRQRRAEVERTSLGRPLQAP